MWSRRSHSYEGTARPNSDEAPEMLAIMGSSSDQATVADFARSCGWGLTSVNTLAQGVSYADHRAVSVILLDRDLASHDWRSTVHRFARNHKRSKPCIILVSSVMDSYLFDEVVKQGGFDVVAKPIQTDEIRRVGHLAVTFWKNCWAGKPNG